MNRVPPAVTEPVPFLVTPLNGDLQGRHGQGLLVSLFLPCDVRRVPFAESGGIFRRRARKPLSLLTVEARAPRNT